MKKIALVLALCAVGSSMTGCAKGLVVAGGTLTVGGGVIALTASDANPNDYYDGLPPNKHDDRVIGAGMMGVGLLMVVGGILLDHHGDTDDAKQQLKLTMDASNPFATNQSSLSMRVPPSPAAR